MRISEAIRYYPFTLYNLISRNTLYKELKNKNLTNNEHKLSEIFEYAKEHSEYYRDRTDFPIVDKNEIQSNIQSFISNDYDKNDLIKITTSGSYGTPSTFYRNKRKKLNQIVDVLYFGKLNHYFFGVKHGFIRGVSKSKSSLFLQNEIHLDPKNLNDKAMASYYVQLKKVTHLVGFPSVILNFIDFCNKYKLKRLENIKGITCTAEALTVPDRNKISEFFGCPVLTRYASEEVGIIANRYPKENFYRVNSSSVKVDLYKFESDQLQEDGLEGRIVVTDLYSHAMPLINYDTGDTGVMGTEIINGQKISVIRQITGRIVEQLYDINDEVISPFSINVLLKDYNKVGQFQFIQTGHAKYTLLVTGQFDDDYSSKLIESLKDILGTSAKIDINWIKDIPSLASGKRPYIRNEYKRG